MVETDGLAGFRRGRTLDKIGQPGQDTSELFFDDCRVPADALLGGDEGAGFAQLMERAALRAHARRAVRASRSSSARCGSPTDYARERKAFGKTLIEMQNTRFKLAEAKTIAHVGRVFIDSCIERYLAGTLDTATASMAKWWLTDMQCQVIDECLQLFGGYGYMREYPIAQMYADARVQRIYGGIERDHEGDHRAHAVTARCGIAAPRSPQLRPSKEPHGDTLSAPARAARSRLHHAARTAC